MSSYVLSPESEDDIFEIWSRLAVDAGVEFANKVESELFRVFGLLAQNPGLGHKRSDLTRSPVLFYRAFPYQHMVIYRRRLRDVEVIAVLHGKRDISGVLRRRIDG